MKLDFDQKILDLDGEPIEDPNSKADPKAKLTLKEMAVRVLVTTLEEDRGLAAEAAFKRYELARLVHKGGELELTPEQATEIRSRLHKCWVLEAAGPAYELLKG